MSSCFSATAPAATTSLGGFRSATTLSGPTFRTSSQSSRPIRGSRPLPSPSGTARSAAVRTSDIQAVRSSDRRSTDTSSVSCVPGTPSVACYLGSFMGGLLTTGSMTVRVLLADEHALFREAVKIILDSQPDLQVVAEVRNGLEAVAEARQTRPHVAVLSADISSLDVGETTRMIKESLPGCGVLIVAARENLATLVASFEGGANGYLTQDDGLDQLVHATRAVTRGETLVPARMLGPLLTRLIQRRRDE